MQPARGRTIADLVMLSAERGGCLAGIEQPPLAGPDLSDRIGELAGGLRSAGLGRGDRIAIVLRDGPDMAAVLLAAMLVGAAAPLDPSYRVAELRSRMQE